MTTRTSTARKTTPATKKAAPAKATKAAPATTTPKLRWTVEGGDRSLRQGCAERDRWRPHLHDRPQRRRVGGDREGGPQDHHVGGGHVREGVCRNPGTPQERVARPDRPVTAGRSAGGTPPGDNPKSGGARAPTGRWAAGPAYQRAVKAAGRRLRRAMARPHTNGSRPDRQLLDTCRGDLHRLGRPRRESRPWGHKETESNPRARPNTNGGNNEGPAPDPSTRLSHGLPVRRRSRRRLRPQSPNGGRWSRIHRTSLVRHPQTTGLAF